jgi:hypothetical protein
MGDAAIKIDLGDTLPYLVERFRQLIGKDQESQETEAWFTSLQRTAIFQASQVQCIGMHRPLLLTEIYQPTRLRIRRATNARGSGQAISHEDRLTRAAVQEADIQEQTISVRDFLDRGENAIVYAGPGWGKTTFLHHVFLESINQKKILPVLVTLRRPTALADLDRFVGLAKTLQHSKGKSNTLLLVDGYDELPLDQRKQVSDAVLRYHALKIGSFYVTCREYYKVFELAAPEVRIDGFTRKDQYKYVGAFLGAFGSNLDPLAVVDDLHDRGFDDFLTHPLLLALACIVKSSSRNVESRSVIRLLERAIDVLTYRWDEEKGIDRQGKTRLDGRDRMQILKRIAFKLQSRLVQDARALAAAQEQLDLLEYERIDPRQVLIETAQFFGIFVPSEDGWEFVHKTLHDYLAAQFWVETGAFANRGSYEWDARTAYAACLMQDATPVMEKALSTARGVEAFVEILSNSPVFDHARIASALINYYGMHKRVHFYENSDPMKVTASLEQPFLSVASSKFLDYLVERCSTGRGKTMDTIAGYCMMELQRRRLTLSYITYEKALALYGSANFTFHLLDLGHIRLSSLKPFPIPQNPIQKRGA